MREGAPADAVLKLGGDGFERPAGLLHRADAGLLLQEGRAAFRPVRDGRGLGLEAAGTATVRGRVPEPKRSARHTAWARARALSASAARRARSYGEAVRLRVSGRSTASSSVSRG